MNQSKYMKNTRFLRFVSSRN